MALRNSLGDKRRSCERGRGGSNEESRLNIKLREGSEARSRPRRLDPSDPLHSAPISSVGKTPGVIFGWLSQLYFLNKQLCTLLSCTACLIRSLLPKQPREMEVSSSHTDHIGLLSREAKSQAVAHACNPGPEEVGSGDSLRFAGQSTTLLS